ncbi:MAG TPA: YdcF family protein, partial [Thermoguttaceae bacterium]|nr:YdcF family protein [Thermoguttaceae bacterium]
GLVATRGFLLPRVARWLDVGQRPRPSDYVLVLGGEENTRPFVAAALVNTGLAKKALLTHTRPSRDVLRGDSPPGHEINRHILMHRGVAAGDILVLGHEIAHTHGEAEALATFLNTSPEARVTVVTSNYHTRRARWVFTRVLGERASRVSFVSAPAYDFGAENWWLTAKGVQTVVGEYLKLVFYGVHYGRLGYWGLSACIAAILVAWASRRYLAGRYS